MQIDLIEIKNFRGVKELKLQIPHDRPLILTGPNGAGKSTALGAIQFALLGNNPTGQNYHNGLLREGAKKAVVAVKVNGQKVERCLPHSVSVTGAKTKTLAEGQLEICNLVRARKADIEQALRADAILLLQSKDQREIFDRLLGIVVDESFIEAKLADEGLLICYADLIGEVSLDLDSAERKCKDRCKELRKAIKNKKAALEELEESGLDSAPPVDLSRLCDLQESISKQLKMLGAAEALQDRVMALTAKVQSLRGTCKAAPDPQVLEAAREDLKARIQTHEDLAASQPANPNEVRRQLEGISTHCDGCGRAWSDFESREKKRKELEALFERAMSHAEKTERALTSVRACQEWIAQAEQAIAELSALKEAEEELRALPSPDVDSIRGVLETLQSEERELSKKARLARDASYRMMRAQELSEEIEDATEELNLVKRLEVQCGPNGIKYRAFLDHASDLEKALNGYLASWGYEFRFGSDAELQVRRSGTPWRDVAAASDGERIVVAVALQAWIAEQTGLATLLIDRVEALDEDNQGVLFDAASSLLKSGCIKQAILAGTNLSSPSYEIINLAKGVPAHV